MKRLTKDEARRIAANIANCRNCSAPRRAATMTPEKFAYRNFMECRRR
jgi:hypothetical protein